MRIYIILILLILTACAREPDNAASIVLQNTGTLELPLPSEAVVGTFCMKYHSPAPGIEYLFYLNGHNNAILVYDIQRQSIYKTIHFPVEGDQGFGMITGFTIKNPDSIYLGVSGKPLLLLTDTTGTLKNRIPFDEAIGDFYPAYSRLFSRPYNDVIFRDNYLLLSQPLNLNGRIPSASFLKNHPLFIRIDPIGSSVTSLPARFPADYFKQSQLLPPEYAVADDGKKIVYAPYCDHHIYGISDDGKNTRTLAKSSFLDEFESVAAYNNPAYYFAKAGLYRNLLYDPYRQLFYRLVKHNMDDFTDDLKPEDAYQYPPVFSIMILDQNLNKIGEHYFNKKRHYDIYQSFVGREGLYISISNPLRPDYEEDKITFELWTPDKI